jgi:cell division protein FtsI (penicillin-binding protein 3)
LSGRSGGSEGRRPDRPRRASPIDDTAVLQRRVRFVAVCLSVLALMPMWKLVEVQAGSDESLIERGMDQRRRTRTIQPLRGSILDRNGTEMAISLPRRVVAVEMPALAVEGVVTADDRQRFGRRLAELLEVDPDVVARRLVEADPDSLWVQIADQVRIEVAERAIREIESDGIVGAVVTGESSARVHPGGESALRILGTLQPDGPGELAGIERAHDAVLSGKVGRQSVEIGKGGATIAGTERILSPAVPGSDVMLTLDRILQHEVEQILVRGTESARAARGVAIVGRPGSGELLAVASVERDTQTGQVGLSTGPIAFSNSYQAGSVFKLVTVAAAVEEGHVTAEHEIEVPDVIAVDDRTFTDHDPHPTQLMTVTQILADSSNVGTIKLGQAAGADALYDALGRFGFGSRTGVGHPAESSGIIRPAAEWTGPDLAASAIGTHQSATALQLWSAYNVIANGGRYVAPRLVDSIVDPDGTRTPTAVSAPRKVISPATAEQMSSMLQAVVTRGTGSRWNLPGYSVAAKTGTSRMVSDMGGNGADGYLWSDGRFHYLASFTGYFPADRPEVSITVILEDVGNGLTGSSAAGPVFSDLARLAIRELGIAPSERVGTVDDTGEIAAQPELVRAAPAVALVPESR